MIRRTCSRLLPQALGLLSLILIYIPATTQAALLAYEPFTNSPGNALVGSADGFGFANSWQANASGGVATNTSFGLAYTDSTGNQLVTSGGAGFFQGLTTGTASMQPFRQLNFTRGTNVDGANTWFSFIVVRSGPTTATANPYGRGANIDHDFTAGNATTTTYSQKLATGGSSGATANTVALIPAGSGSNLRPSTNQFGGATNFVVVKIEHRSNALDNAFLFVNPPLNIEPSTNTAATNSLNGFDYSFDRLRIFAGGNANTSQPYAELTVDEYRIGETYADVTPYFAPGSTTNYAARRLSMSASATNSSVQFAGLGGAGYEFQRSTNLVAWQNIGYTIAPGNGLFSYTEAVSNVGSEPGAMFYRTRFITTNATAPNLTTQPQSLVVTQGNNATFSITATGSTPLRYQWLLDEQSINTATNASLTLFSAQPTDEGNYTVIASNLFGSTSSIPASLTVLIPPSISDQPISQTANVGDTVILSVTADGSAPLGYQWRLNGAPLAGENSFVLTLANVQISDAGLYSVVVTNPAGSLTSTAAALTVNSTSPTVSGVILDDTWSDGTRNDTGLPAESAWYASTASSLSNSAGSLTGITGGTSSRTWWTYFTTNATAPVLLAEGETLKVTLAFTPTGVNANNTGSSMRIGLYDFSNGTRTTADGTSPSGADATGYMLNMNFGATLTSSPLDIERRDNLTGANLMSSIGDYSTLGAGGTSAGNIGFSNNVPYVLEFYVTRNAGSATITTLFTNSSGWNISNSVTDTNTAYVYSFDGFALRPASTTQTATNFTFTRFKVEVLSAGETAPAITSQPASQTVTVGQSALLTATASGTAPLAYQWYFNNTNPVGAGLPTLTLNNVQTNQAGSYKLVVTNNLGAVTSSSANLTVTAPIAPSITSQPTNLTITAGQNATFTAIATGSTPLNYQWFYNTSTLLPGSTNSTLTISNAQAANAGSYSVRVTNTVGAVTSSAAALTVNAAAPSITTQPQSQTAAVSNSVTFTVAASGTAPLSYQWYFNANTVLTGATNTSLTLNSVLTNNAGSYTVAVSNSAGAVTSAVASLTVISAPAGGGEIYVATNGLDANPGTLAQPTTLTKAITLVQSGGTIYLRGGNYTYSAQITIERTNTGASMALPKRIFAYPAEQPVLDFSSQPYGDTSLVTNPRGLQINGHFWHIKGLEVKGSADNGIYVAGNSNIVELCVTHHNRDSGLQVGRYSSSVGHAEWPAYNLILNCDSYDNYDSAPNAGENADGFGCKLTTGPGNVFRGCIAHNNVDDGWDLFTKTDTGAIDPVTIDQCVAYRNGVLSDGYVNPNGDRNGFKLGGSSIAVNHIVSRSIAFSNLHNGFTWNSNPGEIRMINNFAFDNDLGNFKFDVEGPKFTNNLSFWTSTANDQSDRHGVSGSPATPDNCWWDSAKSQPSINGQGLIVSNSSFITLIVSSNGFSRNSDGSIILGNFARLATNSPLIDAGTVPALPAGELLFEPATYYLGDPDIGAVESGPTTAIAPGISTQPASQAILTGQNVTFTVIATGSAPLAYQWFFNTSTALAGATNASYTITAATTNDTGAYSLRITNSVGAVTSSVATLTVTNPVAPSIISQPANVTVATGQSASFSVTASGTAPLSYQWFFNASNAIASATSATYSIASAQATNAGNYTVRIINSAGAITSTVATLTVSAAVPPAITSQPTNTTAVAGGNATFTAAASGSAPLAYQWFFNSSNSLAGATSSTLTLNNIQSTNAGSYSLRVTNSAGAVTSSIATLTVTAVAPSITAQPTSLSVVAGGNATFSVTAAGTAPLAYQWFFNTSNALSGATNASYTITSAQTNIAGAYTVRVTNSVGSVTSSIAILTIATNIASSQFNLYGFAQATTGGGIIAETSANYAKVTNALDLVNAVKSTTVRVIEITTNLDLGWNEIGAAAQAVGKFRSHALPLLHPKLLQTGMSLLDIQKGNLTIFSANGATIKHCNFNVKGCNNVIIRNLKFDENWEWDESTKGNYDRNDWDFITIANGGNVSNVWIDHCTFTKAYDGITDQKAGSVNVTFSWNKYIGDDGASNTNSWVRQQINALETNKASYTFYNFLRTKGFSVEDIVQVQQGHDKTHLAGATSLNAANATLAMTFHHQWIQNVWDRCVPRLRAGNSHNYNLFVDDTQVLAAKRLRDTRAAAMSSADQNTLNNTYNFNPPINGSISTEGGAILVENSIYKNCLWPLRNNQTDPANSVYTGKIMALDSIYHFDNANNTSIDYRGSSTNSPGNTYFGPLQATVIPFTWNLTNGVLPYNYVLDDPSQLSTIVSNYAGAGVLTWDKTNWLKTSY